MRTSLSLRSKVVPLYLATVVATLGQTAASSQISQQAVSTGAEQVSQSQTTIQTFRQEQIALAHQEQALEAAGATQQQMEAWHQQNASLFALQLQRAQSLATNSAPRLRPTNRVAKIPANASPELKNFLTTQAGLANARAKIHNELVQQATASGIPLTFAQVSNLEQQENQLFQKQNAAQLTLHAQQSQALANAMEQTVRLVPRPVVIPPTATPQMAAFLTARSQIRREMVQLGNEYATATPAVRQAALQEWYAQHASQLAQLRQMAESLSQASSPPPN